MRENAMDEMDRLFRIIYGFKKNEQLTDDQKRIIRRIVNGHDTMNVLPTGAGKSACYLVSAMMLPGVTLVITPLLSLMRDQIDKVRKNVPVAALSSEFLFDKNGYHTEKSDSHTASRRSTRDKNIFLETIQGQSQKGGATMEKGYKLLFVTPERLRDGHFIRFAERANISLVAVDEAHCISLWGYEFRRRYLEIPRFFKRIGKRPPLAAFTATATPMVRSDIRTFLGLQLGEGESTGGTEQKRQNLHFSVRTISKRRLAGFDEMRREAEAAKDKEQVKQLDQIEEKYRCGLVRNYALEHAGQNGIIYCSTVRQVNLYYAYFRKKRELTDLVTRYYADLDDDRTVEKEEGESKKKNWNDFKYNRKKIMITTTALGMGVDKGNIHYVLHAGMSLSLENYFQEAGRAGRAPRYTRSAECVLFYLPTDRIRCERLINYSIAESGLHGEALQLRRAIAYDRLKEMEKYCLLMLGELSVEEGGEGLALCRQDAQEYILNYLNHYACELSDFEQSRVDAIEANFRKETEEIDVLYANRTKIAGEIRKGNKQGNLEVGRRGSGKTASYEVIGSALSYSDMLVADAVYTLMKHGEKTIHARSVMKLLSGNHEIMLRPKRTEEINVAIRRMMRTKIRIDLTKSADLGFFYDDERREIIRWRKAIIEDSFLPLIEEGKGFVAIDGKRPPLYRYAEIMNGQFYSIPLRMLRVMLYREPSDGERGAEAVKALPTSMENIAMTHYLVQHIGKMSRQHPDRRKRMNAETGKKEIMRSAITSTVRFGTLLQVLDNEFFQTEELRDNPGLYNRKIRNIKRKEMQILTHLKNQGYIEDFAPATERRKRIDTGREIEDSIRIRLKMLNDNHTAE